MATSMEMTYAEYFKTVNSTKSALRHWRPMAPE